RRWDRRTDACRGPPRCTPRTPAAAARAPPGAGGSGSGRASPGEDRDRGTGFHRSFVLPRPPAVVALESLLPEPEPSGLTEQCLVAEDVGGPLGVELDVARPHVALEAARQVLDEERSPHVVPVGRWTAARHRRQIAGDVAARDLADHAPGLVRF